MAGREQRSRIPAKTQVTFATIDELHAIFVSSLAQKTWEFPGFPYSLTDTSYLVITNLDHIRDRKLWAGLTTVGMCLRERTVNGTSTEETHYFIGSGRLGPRQVARAMQGHWGIENHLHWHLDVHLGEDKSRIQDRNAARNFATMRKLALCVLKRHPAEKSIPRKRKLAAQNPAFLTEVVTGTVKLEEA